MDNKCRRLPVSMLPSALLLLSVCLFVSGCAIFSSATPTATPTPTKNIIPAPQTFAVPEVPCDKAAEMIEQKQVSTVRFWYTKEGTANGISIVQTQATPVPDVPLGLDDIDVYSGGIYSGHYLPTAKCIAQIRAAIKAVNATLPASQQVKSVRMTTYG